MTILVFVGSLLLAMAMGIPIAFALLASGVALMWHLDLFDAQILAQNVIGGADSFPLLAVPFFMLAGEIMNVGGLSKRIVDFALAVVGHVKGGLGYVTIMAGCLLSALSGSAVADAAALTALLLPMMVKAGHDKPRAAGLIAATGVIGPVIPPSIGLVIFGVAANVSISKLFLAAIVPGLLIGAALWLTWAWLVRREKIVPPPRKSSAEIFATFRKAIWALMLPIIILVGLRMGVFTPTEAAVVAAVYALFVSTVIYREITWRDLYGIFVSAAKTSAIVMFLIAAAMVSAWLITVADLPSKIVGLLEPFMGNQILLMIAIMVIVMVVGTAMDMTPTILILTPVLMPVVKAAGIDPVYFGVLFIINNSIGLVTPPVGTVLNVVAGVGKISMDDVTRGVVPFMIAEFAILFVMVAFPQLVIVPARWFGG
ncbi:tripartite ATP-independent transporter DctM subunit [Variovorax boronicumulans]|jgi:tripartite ATP-independent transporter DctM subunit|uniref:TRAP transporter large permease protein n=1 Tax=Variovorax boronicumulans TaxID=436515 RepID=A0AAW8D539_9BURK|nr:TRAP transporter large permease subunit [Variovorax boronicumulans]MDP9895883.1 tripartite ATP-independent transporter DctM subunit [Variovorax boronicumulans]MDP9994375.1 tripartite ATP-independent transporter DctM subunit [Variovorax boronicumulans]MDQ0005476.1 tripartite ATP-independent transporter DctM subunit [Variovorax boronicumulans]MDQ0055923.1 tripartite ATP-independent transporter DctM subunit [Variovorax boronicumulans]